MRGGREGVLRRLNLVQFFLFLPPAPLDAFLAFLRGLGRWRVNNVLCMFVLVLQIHRGRARGRNIQILLQRVRAHKGSPNKAEGGKQKGFPSRAGGPKGAKAGAANLRGMLKHLEHFIFAKLFLHRHHELALGLGKGSVLLRSFVRLDPILLPGEEGGRCSWSGRRSRRPPRRERWSLSMAVL